MGQEPKCKMIKLLENSIRENLVDPQFGDEVLLKIKNSCSANGFKRMKKKVTDWEIIFAKITYLIKDISKIHKEFLRRKQSNGKRGKGSEETPKNIREEHKQVTSI